MHRILQTFLFLLLLISNLFAEEDIYKYKFNLDTIIVGQIIGEGKFFTDYENSFLSISNFLKEKNAISKAIIYDEKFNIIHQISLKDKSVIFKNIPKLFDFDNDGLDEIVFCIKDKNELSFQYFDPSNDANSLTKLFKIPLAKMKSRSTINISQVQLDNDKHFELLVTVSQSSPNGGIGGIWAFDFETMKILWKKRSAEYLTNSDPISLFDKNNTPYLIYSTYAKNSGRFYSNGISFVKSKTDDSFLTYDQSYKQILSSIPDTTAKDYTCDSIAYIRSIDFNGDLIWERILGNSYTRTIINNVVRNGETKILISIYSRNVQGIVQNAFEMIDPITGKVEDRIEIKNGLKYYFVDKNKIFISQLKGLISIYDMDFNLITEKEFPFHYNPLAYINYENTKLLLCTDGTGKYREIVFFDKNLEQVGVTNEKGKLVHLKKAKLISLYSTIAETSRINSIISLHWYERISPKFLMNLTISFLSIVLVTMLLWIITLRVSSKKIRLQKKEIEETHAELKETTSRLIRSEKLAVYGTIASGIAHEINSPLGAIINSAQRIKNNPSADLEKNITLIEKAGKRSKAIIEKLLVTTRSNKDEKTNLVDVLNDWRELSQKQFDNLGISIISTISCDNLLSISSTELNQIITNLLFNARDSITDNNSKIKEISISSQKEENYCYILIQDTGPGFSAAKLENPFEAFVTTKEKGKGTGLGLWVVKNILDNINGSIEIRNYESGAEIEVIIPIFEKG